MCNGLDNKSATIFFVNVPSNVFFRWSFTPVLAWTTSSPWVCYSEGIFRSSGRCWGLRLGDHYQGVGRCLLSMWDFWHYHIKGKWIWLVTFISMWTILICFMHKSYIWVTRMYSHLVEGNHKTFVGLHTLVGQLWLSRMADVIVHIFEMDCTSKPCLEGHVWDSYHLRRGFHMFWETYSLLVLIAVQDTPDPYLTLVEPSNFTAFECVPYLLSWS
jgi:hypothetical protein